MQLKGEYAEGTYARPCQISALNSTRKVENKSAICVLPCGAGKTYTGVAQLCRDVAEAMACKSKSSGAGSTIDFLIAVPIREIIHRWKDELLKCTTIFPKSLVIIDGSLTMALRNVPGPVRVFLITYSMLRSSKVIPGSLVHQVKKLVYRRVVCDECHHVPGENTYRVLLSMKTKSPQMKWMGLTASPINSADKDCVKMVKLMGTQVDGGMSWKTMQQRQYIAPLSLTNVLCPLPKSWASFYNSLLHNKAAKDRSALMRRMELFNPNKLAYIDSLAKKALLEGHKFILFCDTKQLLREMARVMQCEYVDGNTDEEDRKRIYAELRDGTRRMLLVSRIADTGLDFPDVDWAGQVDALGGSQRQKTQRVGRVLRFEKDKNAAFWDVVTTHADHDTHEEIYLRDRDKFLSQQDYKIVDNIIGNLHATASGFLDTEEQTTLLNLVKTYPDVRRECKEIHDEYKEGLALISAKRPVKRQDSVSVGSYLKKVVGQNLSKRNYNGCMAEFEEKKRALMAIRDAKLKGANALIYYDESEFDDASVDEEPHELDEMEWNGEDSPSDLSASAAIPEPAVQQGSNKRAKTCCAASGGITGGITGRVMDSDDENL